MNIGLEIECAGNGEVDRIDRGPHMRTCEIARYFGMTPHLLREFVVENATELGAHKDRHGKWEMPLAQLPLLASLFGERGFRLNSASALLLELIAQLNRRNAERYENIRELKARQYELENENKELNEKLVRIVGDSSQKTSDIANSLIELARKTVERSSAPVPDESPKALSQPHFGVKEFQMPDTMMSKSGPVSSPIPNSFLPALAGLVLFAAGLFVAHLYYHTQQQAVAGANKMISTSLDALSEVSEHAQDDLKDERRAAEDKEKQLELVQAQQKDITKQLYQSQADLKATVKLLQGERQRRSNLEATLNQSLDAQKKLNASQAEVISVQQTELEALKNQLLSPAPKSADAPKSQENGGKNKTL